MPKDHTAISTSQILAETEMRSILSSQFGVVLLADRVQLGDGSSVQIDGYNQASKLFIEIYSRQGPLLDGQKKKVSRDILKLAMLKSEDPTRNVIFCYANDVLSKHLNNGSWLAQAAKIFGVELRNLSDELSEETRKYLISAQKLQATNRKRA